MTSVLFLLGLFAPLLIFLVIMPPATIGIRLPPLLRYYLRLTMYVSTLSVCSVWGVLVSIGMSLAGSKHRFNINYVVARSFYALAGRVMGVQFEVEGEQYLDTGEPSVIVGNHQSMLDIIYLGRIFPRRASILAKKELQWMPFLGQFMSLSGAVFIDRASNKNAVTALAAAGDSMKSKGISLWVFPEGTRHSSKASDLLPFKKGAFHLAVQAKVPIVPVVCENYWPLYHQGVLEPGKLKIRVLPPILTDTLEAADIPDLVTRVRDVMLAALREISSDDGQEAAAHGGGASESTPLLAREPEEDDHGIIRDILPEGRPAKDEGEVEHVKEGLRAVADASGSEDDGVLVDRP